MHQLLEQTNQDIKRRLSKDKDSTVHKTEYQSKRNPAGKPRWAWQQSKHQTLTISSIDKSLSWNSLRVWSLTHWRAIKEESKVATCAWVDHQACSLLQYINVIANLFIMGHYLKLRWIFIRANNLLQFIHQVPIELRFRNCLAQDLFLGFVNNKGADKFAHQCSLISAFVISLLESILSKFASWKLLAFWLVTVAE